MIYEGKKYKPVKDYANEKELTVQAVYQAIKRGTLSYIKIGSYILVAVEDK